MLKKAVVVILHYNEWVKLNKPQTRAAVGRLEGVNQNHSMHHRSENWPPWQVLLLLLRPVLSTFGVLCLT